MARGGKPTEEAPDGGHEPILALVGGRIRAARRRARLKQSDLAEAIGTKQAYMVGVEAGDQNITLKTLARIADALGVAPATLLLEGELALAADEGKLDQFGALLRAAMQELDRASDHLHQAHAQVAPRTGGDQPPISSGQPSRPARTNGD